MLLFCPSQKLVKYSINLKTNNQTTMRGNSIKYLGTMINSYFNWKSQVSHISKKIKRIIGILSKFVTMSISKIFQIYIIILYIIFDLGT